MRIFIILAAALVIAACTPAAASGPLPTGDAAHGAQLFSQSINGAPACSTCHTLDGTALVGPSLQGAAVTAAARVAGQSAEDYLYTSITQPAAFVVSGYSNSMYNQYVQHLSPQDTADFIAFLLTLQGD